MANVNNVFVGTVEVGTPKVVDINDENFSSIQIDVTGSNSIVVATKIKGQSTSNDQATVSAETIILDIVTVETITFTASGGDVPVAVYGY